jgi:hypothetical protein
MSGPFSFSCVSPVCGYAATDSFSCFQRWEPCIVRGPHRCRLRVGRKSSAQNHASRDRDFLTKRTFFTGKYNSLLEGILEAIGGSGRRLTEYGAEPC